MQKNFIDRRQFLKASILASIVTALPSIAIAAKNDFPNKPIKLIVPFGAGGPTDTHLRMLAQHASALLGQSIIIENKPGANGIFGASELARAKPDGYTIAVLPAAVYREPHINKVPFDPLTLTYIIGLSDYMFGLAVKQDAPWQNLNEFLSDVKIRPHEISIGAAGPIQTPSLVLNELIQLLKIDVTPIPYKGDGELALSILGGHVDAGILSGVATTHIQAGNMRYLSMLTPERIPQFPDILTLREQDIDIIVESPYGIAGPKELPESLVMILHNAFKAALESPEGRETLARLNQPLNYRNPEEYKEFAQQAYAKERIRMEQFGESSASN